VQLRELTTRDLTKTVEDATYIAIGMGVLTVQKIAEQFSLLADKATGADLGASIRARVEQAQKDLEARFEPVVDAIEERLPEPAKTAVANGRKLADEARTQIRARIAA
jgi:hypothetical protein